MVGMQHRAAEAAPRLQCKCIIGKAGHIIGVKVGHAGVANHIISEVATSVDKQSLVHRKTRTTDLDQPKYYYQRVVSEQNNTRVLVHMVTTIDTKV